VVTIELFDVQAGFGGAKPGGTACISAGELLEEMQRLDIGRALVHTAPEDMDIDAVRSNEQLTAACCQHGEFVSCPVVVPATGGDFPSETEQVDRAIETGAGAAIVRPERDRWLLADWCSGALFRALAARRLPVLCLERIVGMESLAELASRHAELPLILAEVGYLSQRAVVALLKSFRNVYLSMDSAFTVHCGVEQIVAAVGAERLLFGTGFPGVEPMTAVTQLMYADISDEQKAMIGAGNLERLVGEVRR
jgi:uncharacterized protein